MLMALEMLEAEMLLKNFSRRTMKAYLFMNEKFLEFVRKSPTAVKQSDLNSYLLSIAERNLEPATRHLIVSALKFYYCGILKRRFRFVYLKVPKKLPLIVAKGDVLRMIEATVNLKHKLLIVLLYSSGLRVSEAVKLKASDVSVERKCAIIRQGKGSKDRLVILSDMFLQLFEQVRCPGEHLFFSAIQPQRHITVKTAQKVVEQAAKRAGLPHIHCHALRSSFATSIIENGTDIHYVQKLLCHSSIRTTQGYLRVADSSLLKVKSPLY
jgi:site-specific recombinase XerD